MSYDEDRCRILAHLWRERDPEFAARMQWMHQQHRAFAWPGIGGSYPALTGYRAMHIDASIAEKVPQYGSRRGKQRGGGAIHET